MGQFVVRRLLSLIPVLLGVSIVVFSLIRLIPGDPVIVMLGERARPADIERLREEMQSCDARGLAWLSPTRSMP